MATTTAVTEESPRESRRAEILFGIVAIAGVLPLFASKHLPFTDLPEHVAVASALAHLGDPSFRVAEHYAFAFPRTPYVLFHLVAAALTFVFRDAELVARGLLVVLGLAFPLAMRSVLGAYGLDRRLAILAVLVFWNRTLAIGFLPFVASVPLLLFGVATVVRNARAPALRMRIGLGVIAIAIFYLHVSSYTVFVAIAAATTVHLRGARAAVREIPWLLPSAGCVLLWLASGGIAMKGDHFVQTSEIAFNTPSESLLLFPMWLHDIWVSSVDEACAVVWWASVLVLAVVSMRSEVQPVRVYLTRLLPLLCTLVVYFATPHRAGVGIYLNLRLAPLIALFAILFLRPKRSVVTSAAIGAAALSTLVMCAYSAREIRAGDDEDMGRIDEVLAKMRPGARVIALNFEIQSHHAKFPPWIYAATYHRIRRGGVSAFGFAEIKHWSLQYTKSGAPPARLEPFWMMNPCVYRNDVDGPYYDYVLTRGGAGFFANEPAGPRFRWIDETRSFRLYEKVEGEPPWEPRADAPPGLCPSKQ